MLLNDMDAIRDVTAPPELLEAVYKKGYHLGKSDAAENLRR